MKIKKEGGRNEEQEESKMNKIGRAIILSKLCKVWRTLLKLKWECYLIVGGDRDQEIATVAHQTFAKSKELETSVTV